MSELPSTNPVTAETHWCHTHDGWRLQLLSYTPAVQRYPWPWLCIHGFSQSHRTWTGGGFAQALAAMGCAVYVLDLRGHGGSVRENQGPSLPADWESGWDMDAYFLGDIPAALEWVRERHEGEDVALCGHSMGGVMATATAIRLREEGIAALVPVAAPFDPSLMTGRVRLAAAAALRVGPVARRLRIPWRALPMAHFFSLMDQIYFGRKPRVGRLLPMLAPFDTFQAMPRVWTPAHMEEPVIRDMLRHSFPEPMRVVDEFARWIKTGALYLGHPAARDYTRSFHHISVPVVAAWGEADLLAPPRTGQSFRDAIRSHWHQHLSLPDAHHVDITAGTPSLMILHSIARMLRQCSPA